MNWKELFRSWFDMHVVMKSWKAVFLARFGSNVYKNILYIYRLTLIDVSNMCVLFWCSFFLLTHLRIWQSDTPLQQRCFDTTSELLVSVWMDSLAGSQTLLRLHLARNAYSLDDYSFWILCSWVEHSFIWAVQEWWTIGFRWLDFGAFPVLSWSLVLLAVSTKQDPKIQQQTREAKINKSTIG